MSRIRKGRGRGEKGIPDYTPQTGDVLEVRDPAFERRERYVVLNLNVEGFEHRVERERPEDRVRIRRTVKREESVLLINLDTNFVSVVFCISYSDLFQYSSEGLVERDSQNKQAIRTSFQALLRVLFNKEVIGTTKTGKRRCRKISFWYWDSNSPDPIRKKDCYPKRPSALEPRNRPKLIDAIRRWLRKNRAQQS